MTISEAITHLQKLRDELGYDAELVIHDSSPEEIEYEKAGFQIGNFVPTWHSIDRWINTGDVSTDQGCVQLVMVC